MLNPRPRFWSFCHEPWTLDVRFGVHSCWEHSLGGFYGAQGFPAGANEKPKEGALKMSSIELKSASKRLEAGVPIFFSVQNFDGSRPLAVLLTDSGLRIEVPSQKQGSTVFGELLLSNPGRYQLVLGSTKQDFEVFDRRDLDFAWQFGPVLFAVGLVLMSLALWSSRRARRIRKSQTRVGT
jgi:hypothetical protein